MISLFGKPEPTLAERLKASVSKTKAALSETVDTIFLGEKKVDPALLKQLETALISADLGAALSAALRGQPVPPANHASEVRVALFPQDWIRDPQACDRDKFYLDVPQDDPQLLARGMVVTDSNGRKHISTPIHFANEPAEINLYAPKLGQDAEAITGIQEALGDKVH